MTIPSVKVIGKFIPQILSIGQLMGGLYVAGFVMFFAVRKDKKLS